MFTFTYAYQPSLDTLERLQCWAVEIVEYQGYPTLNFQAQDGLEEMQSLQRHDMKNLRDEFMRSMQQFNQSVDQVSNTHQSIVQEYEQMEGQTLERVREAYHLTQRIPQAWDDMRDRDHLEDRQDMASIYQKNLAKLQKFDRDIEAFIRVGLLNAEGFEELEELQSARADMLIEIREYEEDLARSTAIEEQFQNSQYWRDLELLQDLAHDIKQLQKLMGNPNAQMQEALQYLRSLQILAVLRVLDHGQQFNQ